MKIKTLLTAIPLCTTILFLGCTNDDLSPEDSPVNRVEIPEKVSEGTSAFAFDFIHSLQKTQPAKDNLFVSPLSLHMALGMLLNGAENETAQEMLKALKMESIAVSDLNAAYRTLIRDLPVADPKVSLGLANSIWYRSGFVVEKDFQTVLKESFNAEITGLTFDNAAKDRINQWASDNTKGKIKKVLEDIDPNKVMFLLNALYFKGSWKTQFDAKETTDAPFYLEDGSSKTVKMMHTNSAFRVASTDKYNAVQLPYANGQFSMTLLIPQGTNTVDDVLTDLTGAKWTALLNGMSERNVKVGLPRFTLDYNVKLNETLEKMGIHRIFTEAAQLGKINKTAELVVSFVKQDAFLGVDEQGTEAAAVTSIGVDLTSVGPQEPRYICDRPYGLIISENTSNTILFAGRIKNPESK